MSYEGGGGAQGPAGATGATGATGGISFSGPFGSVLWYDGTGVTGVTGLRWENNGPGGYVMYGGDTNYITFDEGAGSMGMFISQTDDGHGITLSAGNTLVVLTDAKTGIEVPTPGNLQVVINGIPGLSGQVLTSDGTFTTWQAIPTPQQIYTISAYGQTGATGSLLNNAPTGTQLMTTSITTGITGHILGQVAIQIQNSDSLEHSVGVYLTVNGSISGITTHTIPKRQGGFDGSANLTLFHRTETKDPPGTYTISVFGYSDTDTDVFYDHIDLVGLGNLDGPDAPV